MVKGTIFFIIVSIILPSSTSNREFNSQNLKEAAFIIAVSRT